jgi:hypothetical protein
MGLHLSTSVRRPLAVLLSDSHLFSVRLDQIGNNYPPGSKLRTRFFKKTCFDSNDPPLGLRYHYGKPRAARLTSAGSNRMERVAAEKP